VFVQGGEHAFNRESDHVAHRAFDALDQTPVVFLGRIAACLIEGIDALQIGFEVDFPEGPEPDPGGLCEAAQSPAALLHQADARQHFVDPAAKPLEHRPRLGEICRLAEDASFQGNDSIRTDDDAVRESRRHLGRFEPCVKQAELARGHSFAGQLFNAGRFDFKIDSGILQQGLTPRRR
jgi:hypothetical protein